MFNERAANHLLVIDDDPQVLRLVERVARMSGYDVSSSDGQSLPDSAPTDPTLILLDLNLGERDGLNFLQDSTYGRGETPVVLMSGVDHRLLSMTSAAGRDQGFTTAGVLAKPFNIDSLRGLLDRHRRVDVSDLAEELEEAIRTDTISTYYQPIVRLSDESISGAEALVRWHHPSRGLISPAVIIPTAEEAGLLPALTLAMIGQVVRDWASLPAHMRHMRFSVNVPAPVLTEAAFIPELSRLLKTAEMPTRNMTLEITELNALHEIPNARMVMCRLRLMGFEIAMDDLGTGYSSFLALRDLPFSSVKIDRAFVTEIHCQPEHHVIAEAMTQVAHRLGIKVVAEGIENRQSLVNLCNAEVDYGQGYLFSKPVPFNQFRALAEHPAEAAA